MRRNVAHPVGRPHPQAKNYEAESKRKRQEEYDKEQEEGGDDALGAYNPWGGKYKGIDLEEKQGGEEDAPVNVAPVAFKKRKVVPKKGNMRRKTKAADDQDE